MTKRKVDLNNISDGKLISLLEKAKLLIESGEYIFICNALERARFNVTHSQNEVIYLQYWIHKMLGRYDSLHLWIEYEVAIKTDEDRELYNSEYRKEKMVNTRLAWIDWMIDHIERNPR